jgi:tRNA pseudouridine55 synthase
MDGILIIDKPSGITSHDVVSRVRRILKTKRVGHTGTLDPFATGVVVVLVGQATRLAQFLHKDDKEYEATIRFGFETDTGDLTGVRSAECGMQDEVISERLDKVVWDNIFAPFRGAIEQVPPMYSAKKIDGRKLYELARKGETIERKPTQVTIQKLELSTDGSLRSPHSTLRIRVVCSAGTYIRTLAEDIGRRVGVGAHLTELRRTRAGKLRLDESITIEQLAVLPDPLSALVDMQIAVSHLPGFVLNDDRVGKTKSGLSTRVYDTKFIDGEPIRMLDPSENLIAIGFFDLSKNIVQPKVVLG